MTATVTEQIIENIKNDVASRPLEEQENLTTNVSLGDLIRLGAMQTEPAVGWGSCENGTACALSGAALAAVSLGLLSEGPVR